MTTPTGHNLRIERDTMGEVVVPASALYGAHTGRAIENFPISGRSLEPSLIHALARIKMAAARANAQLGVIDQARAQAIIWAAEQVVSGKHDDQFPVDVFQTGSGTSSNMNVNEVLAKLANRHSGLGIHPNDHVNASQSSNDVFPSAVHLMVTEAVALGLVPALHALAASLTRKASQFQDVVKAGRTHLMDATPVTLGQEFGGYAATIQLGLERIGAALPGTAELPFGGTAVGTGLGAPAGFAAQVIKELATASKLPLTEARNHFEAQATRDGLVAMSSVLKTIAVSLIKICNDLRWMASGPNAGLGEINLPSLQPGSSIMPGKVNPVIAEAVLMVCSRVIGNDTTVTWAGASGAFQLNVQMPVIGQAMGESISLLTNSCRLLAGKVIDGITANSEHCRWLAESSPAIVTALNRIIGYDQAARVARLSVERGVTVRQAVIDLGLVAEGQLTEAQLDQALDVAAMTHPEG